MALKIVKSHGKACNALFHNGTTLNLWKFGRKDRDIKLLLEDGTSMDFPPYTSYSRSSFGFDIDTGILAKECCKCNNWSAVAKLLPEGKWDPIPSRDVHFDKIRFRSYCNNCYEQSKAEKAEKEEKEAAGLKVANSAKSRKSSNVDKKKISIHLFPDNYKFVHKLAIDREVNVGDVLDDIITQYRKG